MRLLVRTELGLVIVLVTGALVGYVGLAVAVSGTERLAGLGVVLLAAWWMLSGQLAHARVHRDRGELAHPLWARDPHRRPPWGRSL